jgi:serine protease AprX
MSRRSRRVLTGLAVAGLLATTAGVAGPAPAVPAATGPTTVVYRTELRPDGTVVRSRATVPLNARREPGAAKPAAPAVKPAVRLDPRLAAAARNPATAGARTQVIVAFRDNQTVPQLPDLDPALSRTAPANQALRARSDYMIHDLTTRRQADYRTLSADLGRLDVRTLGTYWLFRGMLVDAPVGSLATLAARDDVSYVGPAQTATPPPADSDPNNDEVFARFLMRTDAYFNQTSGFVGILDTGVRATHTMFNPPHPWIREDLTTTTNPNPDDDCWNHGTSTVGVLNGNANSGASLRGITGITVDSFKVYPANCGGLNINAAIQGFQRAVAVGDRVIVAEMQDAESETSGLSLAADGAFDAGAVVVAANGNNGPGDGTVDAPAVAEKVLGIGAMDLATETTPDYQSRGPAPDGRIKPDLQAPTNVETASSASDTATQVFTGTSCATPQAAGAAALVHDFLQSGNGNASPGWTYSFMLASGNAANGSSVAPPVNNTNGAGVVRLPNSPSTFQQEVAPVGNGMTVPEQVVVPPNAGSFNAVIWWPESTNSHDDVDLTVVDPNGVVRGSSLSAAGVFERVNVVGPLTPGTWTLQLHGFNVPDSAALVYMTTIFRN